MKARVQWTDGVRFLAESGSGHSIVVEGPESSGGRNTAARPMELLLMGLGACSSYDVVTILQKSRQTISDCHVEIEAERADAIPAVFTKIHLHFVVKGEQLKDKQVARAVSLSAEKYCSASIMLNAAGVEITHDYEIIAPEAVD
ncbi:osmotically inducible protein C [Terasakiispira papahanaumokuakeensis]|uniref:Osmotically inducible protein C n=1 Tax=Terasakiispira papahanaumokuakeensis TaxID=197479 RepID=A0A1E2V6C4_9GAMM|nr:OsmC family protein [Terasakiispira papahanaumokuakeensis]ODC02539.1 osmotically inducible protein C [Terasakiispira papahanaumokuakeensis]